ncbi:MAG: hypothetical protein WCG66_06080 [bacterium]
MSFVVLHPGARTRHRAFPDGPGNPDDVGPAPVGACAYAACRKGAFHRSLRSIPAETDDVLLILDNKNLRRALADLKTLRRREVRVRVACADPSSKALAGLLGDVTRLELFRETSRAAHGAIAATPETVSLFQDAGAADVQFLPPPCAVDFPAWDFSQPAGKRRGIFIGTTSFGSGGANHMAALLSADRLSRELECPLAVVNTEGRRGGMILKSLRKNNPLFFIVEAPVDYADMLRVMSLHRIVWQFDADAGAGGTASSALLCRIPCIGGNGAVERIAFPGLSSPASREDLLESARLLLTNEKAWQEEVEASQRRATEFLSFQKTAARLRSGGAS